jgi:hypothetical protein
MPKSHFSDFPRYLHLNGCSNSLQRTLKPTFSAALSFRPFRNTHLKQWRYSPPSLEPPLASNSDFVLILQSFIRRPTTHWYPGSVWSNRPIAQNKITRDFGNIPLTGTVVRAINWCARIQTSCPAFAQDSNDAQNTDRQRNSPKCADYLSQGSQSPPRLTSWIRTLNNRALQIWNNMVFPSPVKRLFQSLFVDQIWMKSIGIALKDRIRYVTIRIRKQIWWLELINEDNWLLHRSWPFLSYNPWVGSLSSSSSSSRR